ncbi:MAG: hypothetical protein ACOC0N_08745 [Chroococcales cyanobacterium]
MELTIAIAISNCLYEDIKTLDNQKVGWVERRKPNIPLSGGHKQTIHQKS